MTLLSCVSPARLLCQLTILLSSRVRRSATLCSLCLLASVAQDWPSLRFLTCKAALVWKALLGVFRFVTLNLGCLDFVVSLGGPG